MRAPSDILRIQRTNEYLSYCLDEAIWWFGTYVEAETHKAGERLGKNDSDKKAQRRAENRFRQIMGLAPQFRNTV